MSRPGLGEVLRTLATWVGRTKNLEAGATATEYAVLVGFIAVVIVAGVVAFGGSLDTWFSTMAGQLP